MINANGGGFFINQSLSNKGVEIYFYSCIFENNLAVSNGGAVFVTQNNKKFYILFDRTNFSNNLSKKGSHVYSKQDTQ